MDSGPALHAYLSYRDAEVGLRWLEQVGFTVVTRQDDPDGTVLHAEVRCGDVVLMVASADAATMCRPSGDEAPAVASTSGCLSLPMSTTGALAPSRRVRRR